MIQTKPTIDPIIRIRKENIQRLKAFVPEGNTHQTYNQSRKEAHIEYKETH